jgi:hypothetical protein
MLEETRMAHPCSGSKRHPRTFSTSMAACENDGWRVAAVQQAVLRACPLSSRQTLAEGVYCSSLLSAARVTCVDCNREQSARSQQACSSRERSRSAPWLRDDAPVCSVPWQPAQVEDDERSRRWRHVKLCKARVAELENASSCQLWCRELRCKQFCCLLHCLSLQVERKESAAGLGESQLSQTDCVVAAAARRIYDGVTKANVSRPQRVQQLVVVSGKQEVRGQVRGRRQSGSSPCCKGESLFSERAS